MQKGVMAVPWFIGLTVVHLGVRADVDKDDRVVGLDVNHANVRGDREGPFAVQVPRERMVVERCVANTLYKQLHSGFILRNQLLVLGDPFGIALDERPV